MQITDYHAKCLAYELTRRCASDSAEKLTPVLADAQVDLNPHQLEAALFAFRSPFSKGAILADEVGLGKTIEAGLLLAQKWAERKRHLLVIVPANLRKQWAQELLDKFHLPTLILETRVWSTRRCSRCAGTWYERLTHDRRTREVRPAFARHRQGQARRVAGATYAGVEMARRRENPLSLLSGVPSS
jgi:SNF2 family DNA or RNA helicase